MLITRIKNHDSLRFTLPDGTTFTVKIEIVHLGAAKTITNAPRSVRVERVHSRDCVNLFSDNKFPVEQCDDAN